ncbi:hypothetical protein AM1_1588 [Acaryochloris marina MBIC11017]|uniref:Uncharacterized protein n=1 Tax=Acaryochloris marina (strain MBIC 11017) TaxID=329726 RepID=B0CA25_ACAM1|nr:hypothetical protein AM1_1588 [Acaryochloris marina MBIC11017]
MVTTTEYTECYCAAITVVMATRFGLIFWSELIGELAIKVTN